MRESRLAAASSLIVGTSCVGGSRQLSRLRLVALPAVAVLVLSISAPAGAEQTDGGIDYRRCGAFTFGTAGADTVFLSGANDAYDGLGGQDQINGLGGSDCLVGGLGQDTVDGGDGNDVLAGGDGGDGLRDNFGGNDDVDAFEPTAGSGIDSVTAGAGDDDIKADDGTSDTIDCGSGQDRVDADVMDSVLANCERRVDLKFIRRPLLTVTGDLRSAPIDASDRDLFGITFEAREAGADLDHVRVLIDGVEEDRFLGDDCAPSCTVIAGEWTFDTDWVSEGGHTIEVAAQDRDGFTTRDTWTIGVPRENHYATALAAWRSSVEQLVDAASPAALTRPLASPPADWRTPDACEASETALRACYDAVTNWGADVQVWLRDNLPDDAAAANLPDAPTFEYSRAEGTGRDLTRRIRDSFALARSNVADPSASIDVAIGFHRPLTPSEVAAAIPSNASLQDQSALTGVFEPNGADWHGSVRVSTPSSIDVSVQDFYVKQSEIAAGNIAELEQEVPADPEEAEDIQNALAQARAFKASLDARGPFVTGVTVRLGPAQAAGALQSASAVSSSGNIKSIARLSNPANVAGDGSAALSAMSVDAAATGGGIAAATAAAEPTCDDRGEAGRIPRSVLAVNPVYFAPSRLKADSVLGDPDGGGRQKVHRLRFRWQAGLGLAWMCADSPGDRNVEMEAMVYPERPRWSDNWESNNARKYTQTNMPGNIHQDDLASGDDPFQIPPGNPFDKQEYPDFAILAQSSRAFRYRKLYFVNFTTNEGETSQGRAIYSAQATHRPSTGGSRDYCRARASDYKSCMISRVEACYSHAYISEGPAYRRVDWSQHLGFLSRMEAVARQHPAEVQAGRQIVTFCDPRPPGSG